MLSVEPGDPRAPGPRALLEASHALMHALFPTEECYGLSIDDLCGEDVAFFTARANRATAILGVGALAIRPGYGEVKAMFTAPEARGQGVGAALLRRIEDEARARALPMIRLETGKGLDEAMRLYERHGFAPCGIFGDYRPNTTSVFMEKHLTAC
ncbi:GNAT family N-acetyltransferase [Roseovarius sp.]|jgi:putative acetyltransferase